MMLPIVQTTLPPSRQTARWRRYWDRKSRSYDREMGFWDRKVFGDTRQWVCAKATGQTLEVAIGTGLNLPFYPDSIQLTGIDVSSRMLQIARDRARQLGRTVNLHEGDAHALAFPDSSFDTVVCTFGLCAIPDERQALREMQRVLRPGGRLLLADHVVSTVWPVRGLQRLAEVVTVPLGGEHLLRRPSEHVRALGFEIQDQQRFRRGIVERLVARKPA